MVQSFEHKQSTLAVYLDMSKAFDTMDHNILHTKQNLNIMEFEDFLLNGSYPILEIKSNMWHICGVILIPAKLNAGCYKVQYLDPLLFIIYTRPNDLPNCLNITKAILFADGTTVYRTSNNMKHLYTIINHELDNPTDWFRANKLSLNISKTNYMLFSHLNKELINTELKLANTTIPKTKCVNFLGLLIDENLKWDKYI